MLSERWVRKYMRLARHVGTDDNRCPARKVGVVLVREYARGSRVVGTGYNSPPVGTPHCDSREYLADVFLPQLTAQETQALCRLYGLPCGPDADALLDLMAGCGRCPRRLVGAASGRRPELCSCVHGEINAICNAAEDLHGALAFCWCPLPCWDCGKALVNAGVSHVYCLRGEVGSPDYSFGSRWLLARAGVALHEAPQEAYL